MAARQDSSLPLRGRDDGDASAEAAAAANYGSRKQQHRENDKTGAPRAYRSRLSLLVLPAIRRRVARNIDDGHGLEPYLALALYVRGRGFVLVTPVPRSLFFNWVMSLRKMENRTQNGRAER